MANYYFETITAAQALSIGPYEGVTWSGNLPRVLTEANVHLIAATANDPERIEVTFNSRTVIFGPGVQGLSQAGYFNSGDGIALRIGGANADAMTGNGRDVLYGLDGNDTLTGASASGLMFGGAGDDLIRPGAGQDTIDGGAGVDTVVLEGRSTDYMITRDGDTLLYMKNGAVTDTLLDPGRISNVEHIRFDDGEFSGRNTVAIYQTDNNYREGNDGLTAHTYHALRQGDTSAPLTVTWNATNIAGADFQSAAAMTGQITFAAGSSNVDFKVYTVADTIPESEEVFSVSLVSTSEALFIGGPAETTDLNDDGTPSDFSISADVAAVAEGQAGTTAITFTVSRTGFTDNAIVVSYGVYGSGAHPVDPTDLVGGLSSDQLIFQSGETSKSLTIYAKGDTEVEPDEGLTVTLGTGGNPNITLHVASASVIVTNDDQPPAPPSSGSGGSSSPPPPSDEGRGFTGDAGPDTIQGTSGADTISGGDGASYLRGGEGNDVITGGKDFDDINGNQGNDTASGGLGDDWVVGGKDNDSLSGDAGGDIVYGNLGDDYCDGGDGDDIVRGGQQNDVILGGAGNDWLSGDRGDDTVTGGAGADIFHTFGDAGIDRVMDFSLAEGDRVMLDPATTYNLSQVGGDTVIAMGGGGQMILVGVSMSSLAGDWIFGA